ncbi:conjugal transfer protein TraA [Pararhizobium sp. A13]|uniref:conjugal transfer protein TraA n=1 Tax=Pararhizobium sp. A13 TaxID=3133975 RepID=UPI00311B42E1
MEFFLGAFTAEWESRKAAFLHDLSLGRRPSSDEDERRRRGGAAGTSELVGGSKGRGGGFRVGGRDRPGLGAGMHRRADRPMRARFAGLASGSQPAVVKMASFGGGGRVAAMITYVSRNGDVVVENERGEQLRGRDQLSAVGSEWDHLMNNRAESRDIGLFHVAVTEDGRGGDDVFARARQIVTQGLGDGAFAFAVSERSDGSGFDIEGMAVLRRPGGERLTADAKASAIVQQRLDASLAEDASAKFQFTGYGNGTDYGASRLRSLVETHTGNVQDEQGRSISDAKQAGDLVQLEWRHQLHSRKPRDVMHLILSARAGTDVTAFQDAARDFLGSQFAGHRYVFSLHDAVSDPKAQEAGGKRPHVHVHAIVAMRSDGGDRIETTISTFRQWRLTMAEKARMHGIAMEMTDRRDRASPAAYSKNQVRPVNTIGRTDHEATSEAAQRRYDAKRADLPSSIPHTARSQTYTRAAQQEWLEFGRSQLSQPVREFVDAQLSRLDDRSLAADPQLSGQGEKPNSGAQSRTDLLTLVELVSEGDDMRHMTRPEFEAYEKRVETALLQAERAMPAAERAGLEAIATAAREHVNVRRELVELVEHRDRGGDQQDRSTAGSDREDERQRWNDAVARYGRAAAEAANAVLVDVERSRDALERAEAGAPDTIRALKQALDTQLLKAAELGAAGNGLIRDVADVDEALRNMLQAVERERQKADREQTAARSERSEPAANPERGAPAGGSGREADVQNRRIDGDTKARNEHDDRER